MAPFVIVPLDGIGSVRLGMTRTESRAAMAPEIARPFSKSPVRPPVDAYLRNAFQVFFDKEDRVEYIEVSSSLEAQYEGVDVFRTPAMELVAFTSRRAAVDESDREFGSSFIFPAISLSFWRPYRSTSEDDQDGRYFMTVGVGIPGYYQRPLVR